MSISPSAPAPYQDVAAKLQLFALDTTNATIEWFVDGVKQPEHTNDRSLPLTTGPLGSSQVVTATITRPDSLFPQELTTTVTPSIVDLIVEGETRTPHFYTGRALPSAGSTVRVSAIPFVGEITHPENYTYKWTLGTTVLLGGPARGKNSVEIEMPKYSATNLIVEVFDQNNTLVGKNKTTLKATNPEVHFYSYSFLGGPHSVALDAGLMLTSDETPVVAEPYFFSNTLARTNTTIEWKVNGSPIAPNTEHPLRVTIARTGGSGESTLSIRIINMETLLQNAQSLVTVSF
ncbi:hypothetical protein KC727_00120 [Candidatus Kaiserbacteria bacterium]|nr:hypothetical protein [Candidatus Kaiserbacteria bacterium]